MKFGYFDAENKEYVITQPGTPLPWMNYLGVEAYFSLISNTAGGYSFYKDAFLRRITRYRYNNVPMDVGGKYLYIRDEETGTFWSPSWKPVKTAVNGYICRHGFSYTSISSETEGIETSATYFVPIGDPLEIWEVNITNTSDRQRQLKVFSFIEWCLWQALDDMTNFQRNFNVGEVEIEDGVIYHKSEYRERRNHFAYFAVSEKISGFDTNRDDFIGIHNGFHEPQAVIEGQSRNSHIVGWAPIGSHCVEVELAPGATRHLNFVLGYHEMPMADRFEKGTVINKTKVRPVIAKYLKRENSRAAFAELARYWEDKLKRFQVHTPEDKIDLSLNQWNQYQCVMTLIFSRSTSFFESGIGRGIGYRDACQDVFGAVHIFPERCRERLIDLAAIQKKDGSTYHQYQPLTKKGNAAIGINFPDDPVWLVLAAGMYLRETGDYSILDESVPYDNDEDDRGTFYEHLAASIRYIENNRGPHGLSLIFRADWNDCINLNITSYPDGQTFQEAPTEFGRVAESMMVSPQFCGASLEFAEIAKRCGRAADAEWALGLREAMVEAIHEHGWDGEWFLRAYDRHGEPVGNKQAQEGKAKIFAESQVWMGMYGDYDTDQDRIRTALDSVAKHLYYEHGVMINQPAFQNFYPHYGEMSSYPPGVKENAAVFCQPNGWMVISEARLGRGEKAMKYYQTILPTLREDISEVHRCEPYVYAQMIAGRDHTQPGEAKNSWLTGTAGVSFYAASQWILGVRPTFDGLSIDPCVPKAWREFEVSRVYRGATYHITVRNPKGVEHGVASMSVDGKPLAGNVIPVADASRTVEVAVTLG